MEGLLLGGKDALANRIVRVIDVNAQPAKFLFHLLHFELASGRLLEFGDQGFQVPA
jgi:hypothetical protein